MRFRLATAADIDELHRLRMAVRENALADPAHVQPGDYSRFLERDGRGWLCEADGRIAGFSIADRPRAHVWALFVDPAFEGRGIGRRLHDLLLEWLFGTGASRVWLSTDPGTRAQRLYERSGWRRAGPGPGGEVRYEIDAAAWRQRERAPARIGLISDTHGLLRPEALAALRGCDHIVHAGDIGDPAILAALEAIAPVTAVRGNNDRGGWARSLPEVAGLRAGAARILVAHDASPWRDRPPPDVDVLVTGHSHQPRVARDAGLLRVNPGSAGPRRFSLPVSVGFLEVSGARIEARLATLEVSR